MWYNTYMEKTYYAYMLICADGTIYTGYTDDIERRINVHNSGKGAKYTRARLPVRLAHCEAFPSRGDAQACEAKWKRLARHEKLQLIETQG